MGTITHSPGPRTDYFARKKLARGQEESRATQRQHRLSRSLILSLVTLLACLQQRCTIAWLAPQVGRLAGTGASETYRSEMEYDTGLGTCTMVWYVHGL